jgi:hypothetical protein
MSDDVEHSVHRSATSAARAALAAASPDATAAVVPSPAVSRLLSPPSLSTPMAPPAAVLPQGAPTPDNPPARSRISLQDASPRLHNPLRWHIRYGGQVARRSVLAPDPSLMLLPACGDRADQGCNGCRETLLSTLCSSSRGTSNGKMRLCKTRHTCWLLPQLHVCRQMFRWQHLLSFVFR